MPNHIPKIEARAAIASLTAAITLLALKFAAFYLTNSSAIFSDALESIANLAAAGFALYALRMAHEPADQDHPYGHGKIEFVSAGFEGSMILTAAVVGAIRAVETLLHPADLHLSSLKIGLGLLAIALIVNGIIGLSLVRVGRRVSSATLEADGRHLLSDALTSIAAIAGLIVVRMTGWTYADPITGLVVACYIGLMGLKLMRTALGGLMDQQDQHDEQLLKGILDTHIGPGGREPQICSYHKVRHRHSGRYHWVDFHIMMPAHWDIRQGHQVATMIEDEIEQALGSGNATAHIEPCGDAACPMCAGVREENVTGGNERVKGKE